ncbi:hypothetical protein DFP72DRAFT_150670 [Ephemerocybe angulata]|uniref:Uncharacterized protein n=1 Tax=Ephemerocybe angulata TaxID=980116 RepID=A0A8H6I5E9_9AGAR|nr:hypothetical protein DFP72DRAFT_150670 [Tulosesus angulatus]
MSCPKCVEGYELPGEPTGSIHADYQGAYLAPGPPDGQKGIAVVFLTDGFGLPLKNCKIIADKIAERIGCDVWVPDYFAASTHVTTTKRRFARTPPISGIATNLQLQINLSRAAHARRCPPLIYDNTSGIVVHKG